MIAGVAQLASDATTSLKTTGGASDHERRLLDDSTRALSTELATANSSKADLRSFRLYSEPARGGMAIR